VDGCIPGLALTDTVKEARDGFVVKTIPRGAVYQVQTPQAFVTRTILQEHGKAAEAGSGLFTDDSSLLEAAGRAVRVVRGDPFNIKITFQEDIPMAEAILRCL
jgi:2-C-methyl-D-erythritol 4-phosphate cytidylyltransferase